MCSAAKDAASCSRTLKQNGNFPEQGLESDSVFGEVRLYLPIGPPCHFTVFCFSCNLKSVRREQISFHTLAFLTFRWQLLSWHMCGMLLSTILATTAALTVHRHRGHSVDLCDSLWLAKRYQVEGPKQKQFSGAEGNILRSSELHFFSHIHFTWSLVSNTFIMSEQRPHNSLWHSSEYRFPKLSWCIHAIVILHVTAVQWSQFHVKITSLLPNLLE